HRLDDAAFFDSHGHIAAADPVQNDVRLLVRGNRALDRRLGRDSGWKAQQVEGEQNKKGHNEATGQESHGTALSGGEAWEWVDARAVYAPADFLTSRQKNTAAHPDEPVRTILRRRCCLWE